MLCRALDDEGFGVSKTKLHLYKDSLKSNSTEDDIQCYKHHQNLYNQLKRKLRTDYYCLKCESYKSNAKKLWSLINQTITKVKHKGSIIPSITVDGIKYNKPKTIANKFGEFYSQLGSTLAKSIVPGMTSIDQYMKNIPRQINSIVIRPTSVQEIDRIIRELPNKTSYGYDEISNTMLKALHMSITFPLCHIFNQSLQEGIFPERMKWVEVIPLYKGKCMDVMVNYRPISLLITLSKILEKIMYKHLYSILDTKGILYASQYAFCSKHSCEQAIAELLGYILLSKNRNEHSASVFLDLSKTFDILDHQILLSKLSRYGIRGAALEWFGSYLQNRSLFAKI